MSNYDDLLRDKENNDSFDNKKIETNWIALEKQLDNIEEPILKKKKPIRKYIAIAAGLIIAVVGFFFIKNKKSKAVEFVKTEAKKSAIKPALTWINLPYEKFEIDAEKGDTIFTQNGSIIVFPANALLNSKGEIVKGKIEIQSREFNDPIDYSIAGIPMDYDSASIKYKFISSGMIDITAYQNNEKLQVNPQAKPKLNLVSTNTEKNTNLYKLDTVTGIWENKGKDVLSYIPNTRALADINTKDDTFYRELQRGEKYEKRNEGNDINGDFFEDDIVKPLPPQKPNNTNPIINIEFVPGSFKELAIYDGLKFEVFNKISTTIKVPVLKAKAPSQKYDPSTKDNKINTTPANPLITDVANNSKIDWENIELLKTNVAGEYKVIFTSGEQSVTYLVKPVLEGNDFVVAEKKYQQKMQEYENVKNNRLQELGKAQKNSDEKVNKQNILNQQIEEQNNKTNALNKIIEKRNELVEARNKFIEEQRKIILNQIAEAEKTRKQYELEYAKSQGVLRTFEIDGFGYWNCDKPSIATPIYVNAIFEKAKNKPVVFNSINTAVQKENRLINCNGNQVPLIENKVQCIFAYANDKLYYLSYNQFANLKISRITKEFRFVMNEYSGDKTDYATIKKLITDAAP